MKLNEKFKTTYQVDSQEDDNHKFEKKKVGVIYIPVRTRCIFLQLNFDSQSNAGFSIDSNKTDNSTESRHPLSNSSHCFTNFLIPLRRVARY
jgi:hypothetical protein